MEALDVERRTRSAAQAADLEHTTTGWSPLSSPQPSTGGLSPISSPLRSPWRTATSSLPPSSTAPRPDSSTQCHGEPAGGATGTILPSHLISLCGEGRRPGHGEESSCPMLIQEERRAYTQEERRAHVDSRWMEGEACCCNTYLVVLMEKKDLLLIRPGEEGAGCAQEKNAPTTAPGSLLLETPLDCWCCWTWPGSAEEKQGT